MAVVLIWLRRWVVGMNEEILSDLYRLQQYAAGLQNLIAEAEAGAPQRVEAADASGAVRVAVGADGRPETITVEADWKRRLSAEAFGSAVVEAFAAASEQRTQAWARALSDREWQAKAEHLKERIDSEPVTTPLGQVPEIFRRDVSNVRPRNMNEIATDVIEALDNVDDLPDAQAQAVRGIGSTGFGKLEIVLTPAGITSCRADPHWVSQRTGEELTDALATALAAAREELANAAAATPTGRIERLLDETLALMGNPDRLG